MTIAWESRTSGQTGARPSGWQSLMSIERRIECGRSVWRRRRLRILTISNLSLLCRRLQRGLLKKFITLAVRTDRRDRLVRLGSAYGGWWVPESVIAEGRRVVSAGVGEDTTFDEMLVARLRVWALDPTPRAAEHVRDRRRDGPLASTNFRFLPIGLWWQNETMRFYEPQDPSHVSHSLVNIQRTDRWFEAECWSFSRLLDELAIQEVDVLELRHRRR